MIKQITLGIFLLLSPLAALTADDNVIYWTGLNNRWGGGDHNSFSQSPKGDDFERVRSGDSFHMVYNTNVMTGRRMNVRMNRVDVTMLSLNLAAGRNEGFTFDTTEDNSSGIVLAGPVNVVNGRHTLENSGGVSIRLAGDVAWNIADGARLVSHIPFSGNAGILKTGNGTLIFRHAENTFAGPVVVRGGALGGNGSLAGSLVFEKGTRFQFNPNATLNVKGVTAFAAFGVKDIAGLDAETAVGSHVLVAGTVEPANIANLGAANAHEFARGKVAYLEADEAGLRLIVETRSRRGR